MAKFKTGQKVCWKWGNGTGEGKITEIFTSDVTRELQGAEVTRNASEDEPAYLIEQDDGSEVLKSCSEIQAA
jgi:hypothetical protein